VLLIQFFLQIYAKPYPDAGLNQADTHMLQTPQETFEKVTNLMFSLLAKAEDGNGKEASQFGFGESACKTPWDSFPNP
jgi:hypothetical protein